MPITFQCPHCGSQTQVDDRYAGQSGACRSCGATITIPGGPVGAPAYPQRSSSSAAPIVIILIAVVVGGLLIVGILAALLLPAVQAAREAARRSICVNNVKQIGLALQEYADVYKMFPPAYTVDAAGKRLHSWRVLILPFVEQKALYDQIHLDEPWDSPNNIGFAARMPSVYACPSNAAAPGSTTTDYAVVEGPGSIFDGDKPCHLGTVRDGLSNTLLVVEASGANIPWMEPRDLDFARMQCVIGGAGGNEISSHHPGTATVGFADGSARTLTSGTSPAVVRSLMTRGGGEAIPANY
jgi:prepilin-type processing-associated H-X9-DG protein